MYSIETKKRKFDRIVDTIKIGATPGPNSAPLPKHDSITLVESNSMKRRRLEQLAVNSANSSMATLASAAEYLPSSREAFLDRLESFRPIIKWHVPSTEEVSAVAWSKRGWRCVDTDTVGCQACKEQLLVKIEFEDEAAAEASSPTHGDIDDFVPSFALRHTIAIKKYQELTVTAHAEGCPWRVRGCDDTIQRLPGMLNGANTLKALRDRYDGLKDLEIPTVYILAEEAAYKPDTLPSFTFSTDAEASTEIAEQQNTGKSSTRKTNTNKPNAKKPSTNEPNNDKSNIDKPEFEKPDIDKLRLAVCGWQLDPSREDVVECRACFRSLGLWMYRGSRPLMEKLDALDSHLEYCPWRSGTAQHTEIFLDGGSEKVLVPAWTLVGRAIDAELVRRAGGPAPKKERGDERYGMLVDDMEDKERESRVSDLLRRVKELRRPFKKLLKTKTKVV